MGGCEDKFDLGVLALVAAWVEVVAEEGVGTEDSDPAGRGDGGLGFATVAVGSLGFGWAERGLALDIPAGKASAMAW